MKKTILSMLLVISLVLSTLASATSAYAYETPDTLEVDDQELTLDDEEAFASQIDQPNDEAGVGTPDEADIEIPVDDIDSPDDLNTLEPDAAAIPTLETDSTFDTLATTWDPSMPLPSRSLTNTELNAWIQRYQQQGGISQLELEVLRLTNIERAKVRVPPLGINLDLSMAARFKSQEMVNLGYFDHTSPVYGSFIGIIDLFYPAGLYGWAGENIFMGPVTAEDLVNGWMSSPGHRANMLNPNYQSIGIGHLRSSYSMTTQQFSSQPSTARTPVFNGWKSWPNEGNARYYFRNGVMQTGWQRIDGVTYYFDLTTGVQKSFTAIDQFVIRLYSNVFGRLPDESGSQYWAARLRSGTTGASVAHGFFFSPEFRNRKTSNELFLDILYSTLLNRSADAGGKAFWLNQLNSGIPRENIFAGFVNSPEFDGLCKQAGIVRGTYTPPPGGMVRVFVTRLYREALSRDPDQGGLDYWTNRLLEGASGSTVANGFVFSNELTSQKLSNEDFVEVLYKTLMGRSSDLSGKAFWVDRLNNGYTRQSVFQGFVSSPEFGQICTKHGIKR